MRNAISKTINYIGQVLQEDDFIKAVYSLNQDDIDTLKNGVFPLANVQLTNLDFNQNTLTFEVLILCQREDVKRDRAESWHNDNKIDNYNLAYSVLQNLKLKLKSYSSCDDFNLQLLSVDEPSLIDGDYFNKLDGMICNFVIQVPNRISVCEC